MSRLKVRVGAYVGAFLDVLLKNLKVTLKLQWGDKWTESFKDGRGSKHGEVWTVSKGGGERYQVGWA